MVREKIRRKNRKATKKKMLNVLNKCSISRDGVKRWNQEEEKKTSKRASRAVDFPLKVDRGGKKAGRRTGGARIAQDNLDPKRKKKRRLPSNRFLHTKSEAQRKKILKDGGVSETSNMFRKKKNNQENRNSPEIASARQLIVPRGESINATQKKTTQEKKETILSVKE